jgi:hypothetical protein
VTEVEGRWGGYGARIDQSISIGDAAPLVRDSMQLAIETLDESAAALRPGASVADVVRVGRRQALGGRATSSVSIKGCGTGDDGPMASEHSPSSTLALLDNCVVSLQVQITVDGQRHYGCCGESFVIRNGRSEALIKRQRQLNEV